MKKKLVKRIINDFLFAYEFGVDIYHVHRHSKRLFISWQKKEIV